MARASTVKGGLGTRVAVRTFIVFGLCAALPVALFSLFGYAFVSEELAKTSRARLDEASKRYGIALNQRLIQAEESMIDAARLALESGSSDPAASALLHRMLILSPLSAEGMQIDGRSTSALDTRLPPGWRASRALQVESSASVTDLRLVVTVSDGTRQITLVTDPTNREFWNADVVLPGTRACVYVLGRRLHCESAESWSEAQEDVQRSEWTLFLKPRFGAESWMVRVEEPGFVALGALSSFRYTLPIVALIAVFVAWLLSFTHIRRIHRPLMLLTSAAQRMSRGRFGEPVKIVSDDEFASVGRALNHLDERLKRQFGLISTLASIDQQILEHPTFQPVVTTLLPRMPRILGCRACAVAIESKDTATQMQFYRADRSGKQVESLALAQGADVDAALADACPDVKHWLRVPIDVAGEQRGVLLAGFRREGRARRLATNRQLRGLAHRLAVALGNEDRERALVRQAYFDPLTGLANRQLCRDRLDQALLLGRRDVQEVAVLHIDIDHFKNFNDSLGQSAGDALLKGIAARLQGSQRDGDTLARLGADEFVLLLPGCGSQHAAALATRLLHDLAAPLAMGADSYVVQASIGIAVFPQNGPRPEELLRCASAALSRAKSSGRGRVAFFEDGMNRVAERRLVVEQRLRSALESGLVTFVYQPKFRTGNGALSGFEALARWQDAELGPVAPSEFIPIAEDSGLIGSLGNSALRESCRQMREWRSLGLHFGHVAVNVSVRQLGDPQFPAYVGRCLADFGLEASTLELEITESTLATNDDNIIRQLSELRAAGIRIAMDDFGTGYSSLASLRELPIDVLKIDRSFIVRSCDSQTDESLLRGLIELSHTMGKVVVAEGVETHAQLTLLRELGCDVVQGYLLSKPLPAAGVAPFLVALTPGSGTNESELRPPDEMAALA